MSPWLINGNDVVREVFGRGLELLQANGGRFDQLCLQMIHTALVADSE